MALISNFVIFSLFACLLYFIGLLTFVIDHEENKCQMTYMFEYPQFVKIDTPMEEKHPRYALYAYSEGRFTERVRSMKFDGIPVLFVPGNAGSYKQVRSLASVALRKAIGTRTKFHFDFFTVDLNGELSGLHGALLDEQTRFLNESIHRVLALYENGDRPKSVVLIGHSMGGIVAYNIASRFRDDPIVLLITLASPHRRPSICLDRHMENFYLQNVTASTNLTFVSIAGGNSDRLVHVASADVNTASLSVVTTAVPTVWLSTDHQCIVWCKQLVLTIVRALFDSVDPDTKQISMDNRRRLASFKYHLLTNGGVDLQQAAKYKAAVRFRPDGEWHEDLRRQYSVMVAGKSQIRYLMIRLFDDPKYRVLHVRADNLMYSDWIFACSADVVGSSGRICEEGIHLSHRSELTPSWGNSKSKSKTFQLDLFKLKKRYPDFSHVLIKALPQAEPIVFHFDIHDSSERRLPIDLPAWYSLTRKYILKQTPKKHIRYVLELPNLQHVIQTYLLYVEPVVCEGPSSHASAKLTVPWAHHDTYVFITEETKKPLLLRLYASKPSHVQNSTAKVVLNLDPTCEYSISVRNSFIGSLSQFARYYSPMLVSNVAAVILITFYSQVKSLDREGRCKIFQEALSVDTKPYYLVTGAKLLTRVVSFGRFADLFPTPDGQVLIDENLDFLLLPLLLYIIAVGLTYLCSVVLWSVLILSESTVHKLAAKGVARTFGGAVKMSDWLLNALHKVPCVVAITLFGLGFSTCGGLALALGSVYYFLKLTQMCQEYVERLVYRVIKWISRKFLNLIGKSGPKDNQNEAKSDDVVTSTSNDETKSNSNDSAQSTDQNEDVENVSEESNDETIDPEADKGDDDSEEEHENDQSDDIENIDVKNISETIDDEIIESNEVDEIVPEEKNDDGVRCRKTELEEHEDQGDTKQENDQETIPKTEKETKRTNNTDTLHFHFTLFLLWFLMTCINIPVVLTWARNFHYSNTLRPDHSTIPGLLMSLCAGYLWQTEVPKTDRSFYKQLAMFLYVAALSCLIYGTVNIHRITYIVTCTFVVVTLHQMFAPKQDDDDDDESNADEELSLEKDPIEHVEEIKAKME